MTKFVMETANIPMTQESLHVRITNEDNTHHFLQYKGIVHFEFIPQSQTVNQAYYVDRKRSELWPKGWIFHHDAAAYKVLSVKQFPAQK